MDTILLPAGNEPERIARLEERMGVVQALLEEIRRDQKIMADALAHASGGFRVLLLLGGLASVAGALRGLANWAGNVLGHPH